MSKSNGQKLKKEAAAVADLRDRAKRIHKAFLTYGRITDHRAIAIVSAVLVEECLGRLLRAHLREGSGELFNVGGPLSTHSARYRLAYAMSLIGSDVRNDLEVVAKIRNKFAHSIDDDLTFENDRFAPLFDAIVVEGRREGQTLASFYRRTCETLALPFWLDERVQAHEDASTLGP